MSPQAIQASATPPPNLAKHHVALLSAKVSRDQYPAGTYPNVEPAEVRESINDAVNDAWKKGRENYEESLVAFTRANWDSPNFKNLLLQFIQRTI